MTSKNTEKAPRVKTEFVHEPPAEGEVISARQAARLAAFANRLGLRDWEKRDAFSSAFLVKLENPTKDQSALLSAAYRIVKQQACGNVAPTVFLDRELRDGEKAAQIEAPEEIEIEQWRRLPLDSDFDGLAGLRGRLTKGLSITDRRARQILDELDDQLAQAEQNDLFGRDSVSTAVLAGRVTRRPRCKKNTVTVTSTTEDIFGAGGEA